MSPFRGLGFKPPLGGWGFTSFETSATTKRDFERKQLIKEEQRKFLQELASNESLWISEIPVEWVYLTHGGEAQVYINPDELHVLKLNDAVYYATWLEYFNSLVIHNLLFPSTAYSFYGFLIKDDQLMAVLKQPYVLSNELANLEEVKKLLEYNGFKNAKRQDYINEEFGLLLEDMHDENVLSKENSLFFIDTVFYITK